MLKSDALDSLNSIQDGIKALRLLSEVIETSGSAGASAALMFMASHLEQDAMTLERQIVLLAPGDSSKKPYI